VPKGEQVLCGGEATGEVGRADASHLPSRQVERINDDKRQAGSRERGKVTLAQVIDDVDHGLPAHLGEVADPGGRPFDASARHLTRADADSDGNADLRRRTQNALEDLHGVTREPPVEDELNGWLCGQRSAGRFHTASDVPVFL
jgi:hypothetical protein